MLREIRLYGELGRRFGRVHRLAVASVGEAVRALTANFPGFEQAFIDHKPGFRVWSGPTRIGQPDDINLPSGGRDIIRIAPVTAGAGGNGIGAILLGVALIAAAFISGGATIAATGFLTGGITTTFWGNVALSIGAGLVIGGVSQMLAPQPKLDAGSGDENKPSYAFNGAVNTTAQGHPVPIGYGRLIVGSAVISAGLTAEDIETDRYVWFPFGLGWQKVNSTS